MASDLKQQVRTWLAESSVKDLPPPSTQLLVIKDESLTDAFGKLLAAHVLSAPVVSRTGYGFAGFLDIRALVSAIGSMNQAKKTSKKDLELGDLVSQLSSGTPGSDHMHVWTPEYVARINPIRLVTPASSLLQVCEIFASGVKRVAVMEDDGQQHISRIVSQSWLVNALSAGVGSGAETVTLRDLGVAPKNVLKCHASQHAIDAFKLMDQRQLSAVALVDESGNLVGQFAPEQLQRFLLNGNLDLLENPISAFVPVSHAAGSEISVTLDATLRHTLQKFVDSKSHRLFLVDENQALIGVLSLKDLFGVLLK